MKKSWQEIEKNPDFSYFNHYKNLQIPSPVIGKNIEVSSFNIGQGQIICVDGFIENCQEILDFFLSHELQPVAQDGYAKNWTPEKTKVSGRLSTYDLNFSNILSQALKNHLFSHQLNRILKTSCVDGQDKNHEFVAINPYVRFVHYENQQKLIAHYDGHHHFSDSIQTVMTALVYLNNCETGNTVFLKDPIQDIKNKKLITTSGITQPIFSIQPRQGRVLFFDQYLLHCTSMLENEKKSLLLTDFIMQVKS